MKTLLVTNPEGVHKQFIVDKDTSDLYVACNYWYPNNAYSDVSNCPVALKNDAGTTLEGIDPAPDQTPGPQRVDYHFTQTLFEGQLIEIQFVASGTNTAYWMGVIDIQVSTDVIP